MLHGDWYYRAPIENEKIDAKGREMLDMMFGEMTFSFSKGGSYIANFMGKEDSGTWSLNDQGTEVTLTSVKDPEAKFGVLSLTAEEWRMEISKGKGLIMAREPLKKN